MTKNKVYQGQSFLDKVLETTGSIENAFEMAFLNGISVTDDVAIGQNLLVIGVKSKEVISFFNEYNRPATGLKAEQIQIIESQGIGSMKIGSTFIVAP